MTNKPEDTHLEDDTKLFPSLDGLQILVVDDNADSLLLIAFILEGYGVRVITATSALEALEKIKQLKFDILICDIAMPEVDGYSLIRQVRKMKIQVQREVPAIALTALGIEEGYDEAILSGFQSYINKPIEPHTLLIEITKILRISRSTNGER